MLSPKVDFFFSFRQFELKKNFENLEKAFAVIDVSVPFYPFGCNETVVIPQPFISLQEMIPAECL